MKDTIEVQSIMGGGVCIAMVGAGQSRKALWEYIFPMILRLLHTSEALGQGVENFSEKGFMSHLWISVGKLLIRCFFGI